MEGWGREWWWEGVVSVAGEKLGPGRIHGMRDVGRVKREGNRGADELRFP